MNDPKCKTANAQVPAESTIVDSSWAESQHAKGLLTLTNDQLALIASTETIAIMSAQLPTHYVRKYAKKGYDWIEPIDAVYFLAPELGGVSAAKAAIAEQLRDGAITCTRVWMSEGPDIGPIANQRPKFSLIREGEVIGPWVTAPSPNQTPVILGPGIWSKSDDWKSDQDRWNWRLGMFVVSWNPSVVAYLDGIPAKEKDSGQRLRMAISGVRFNRSDIEKMLPQKCGRTEPHADVPRPVGTNGVSANGWNEWVAELLMVEHEGGITARTKASELVTEVTDRLAARGVRHPSIQRTAPVASAVMKALRSRGRL